MTRRHITANVLALYVIQGMQYVFPLLVLPIVTRAVGPERYGTLSFWQALAGLLTLVVEYGFNYTSTRSLNQAESDDQKSIIFWSTTWAKLALLLPATAILLVTAVALSERANTFLVLATWLPLLGAAISPAWYFVATRQTLAVASISVAVSLVSTLAMFAFVSTPADFGHAVLIQLGMPLAAALALSAYQFAKLNIGHPSFSRKAILTRLGEGFPVFIMAIGAGAYSSFNPFLLGLVSTSPQVANYALGERLVRAAKNAVQPILTAMYPYAAEGEKSSEATRKNLRRAGFATFAISAVIAVVLAILAPLIIRLLSGDAFLGAISTTRILAANVAVITAGHLIGVQYLVARGKERLVTMITVVAAPIHLIAFLLAGKHFGAVGGATAYVGIECLVTAAFGIVSIQVRKRI